MPSDSTPSTHTHFFRDEAQLERIVDALAARDTGARIPTLWSAGCSTGAEPYSLAMLCAERSVRVAIEASDFRADALAIAQAGRYEAQALRHASPERIARFFDATSGGSTVRPAIRGAVRFALHDLCALPGSKSTLEHASFDVIVCRNVLIYYDLVAAARLVTILASRLAPGGLLFLGASDHFTFRDGDVPLERVEIGSTTAYRVEGVREAIASVPTPPLPSTLPPAVVAAASPRSQRAVSEIVECAFASIARHAFDEAERLLRDAIEQHPTAPEPLYYLGLVHRKQGRLRDAVEALRTAHFLAADFWPAPFLLAGVWDRLGRSDRAQQVRRHVAMLLERGVDLSRYALAPSDPLFDPAQVLAACRL